MKKHTNTFRFFKIILLCYILLSFILDIWNPFMWSQDSRIILVIWIFVFMTLASVVDALKKDPWG